MPVRSRRGSTHGGGTRGREPVPPRPPASLDQATTDDHGLADDGVYRRLGFSDIDLSGRTADSVECEQCRFHNADMSSISLAGATLRDCLVESSNWANLRAEKSAMVRVRLSASRLTGLCWVNGSLRDVRIDECRADLASFRFSDLQNVVFQGCNLTRADFQNADISGVQFRDCDLTAAQFSHATMNETRFTRCVLAGIGGVASFAGAVVTSEDLVALAHSLAAALGIRIETAGEDRH